MQIKSTYVMEQDFIHAFDELLMKPMPAKQCLEMITSSEKITEAYNRLIKAQLLILKQYCVVKENGDLEFTPKGDIIFKDDASKVACNKEVADLKAEMLEIPLTTKVKVYSDDVSTPRKVFLLKDLIEIVEREIPPVKTAS